MTATTRTPHPITRVKALAALKGEALNDLARSLKRDQPEAADDWPPGAIYCRISDDREGLARGVEQQATDGYDLANKQHIRVVDLYVDNDIGASTRTRPKPRPGFNAMMASAEAGHLAALLAYSNSRFTRRPREVESLIELFERRGTLILTLKSGNDDLSTADGRMVARIKGNVDTAESERISERVKTRNRQNAMEGSPGGGIRPFGYAKDRVTIVPAEAELIKKAAADVIAGVPTRVILDRWAAAGVKSTKGGTWAPAAFKAMIAGARVAGWRVYCGEIARDRTGAPIRGQWEPILDEATHAGVVAVLKGRADAHNAKRVRPGNRRYLLTGLVRCGQCGGAMYGNRRTDTTYFYRCAPKAGKGHVTSVSGNQLDRWVSMIMVRLLQDRQLERIERAPFTGDARLAQIEEMTDVLLGQYTAGVLKADVLHRHLDRLQAERDTLTAQRDAWLTDTHGPDLTAVDEAVWDAADDDRRRAMLGAAFEAVYVKPAPLGHRTGMRFDPDRVELVRRTVSA